MSHELDAPGREPPEHTPAEHRRRQGAFPWTQHVRCAISDACGDEARCGNQYRAGKIRIGEQRVTRIGGSRDREEDPGADLDEESEGPREGHVLPHANPVHAYRLDRPDRGRVTVVEREWNRDGRKNDRQRSKRAGEERISPLCAFARRREENGIERRDRDRAPRDAMVIVVHERHLQREADHWNAEDQQAVDRVPGRQRSAPHVEDRDPHIEDEEQREEWLDDRVMSAIVELAPPRQAEHEREHEPNGVERAPGLGPGEREDRGVQDGEVAEQQQGVAVVADEHRGEESAGHRQRRERLRIGAHGQPDGECGHAHEQHDRRRRGQHAIAPERRIDREIEDSRTRALQRKTVGRTRCPQA